MGIYYISGIKLQNGCPPKLIFVLLELTKPNHSVAVTQHPLQYKVVFSYPTWFQDRFGEAEQNILPWGQHL